MQYSVLGSDGNQYGPVDLATLKEWVSEGRITSATKITDQLANRELAAWQIPELDLTSPEVLAPPTGAEPYANYPRSDADPSKVRTRTRFWGILIWFGIAVFFSLVSQYGGIWISGWNVYDAIQAKRRRDPMADWCMLVGVGGFVLILLWTILKYQAS